MCPQCGSPGVDYSGLAGGAADCRGCRWKGQVEDLLAVPGSAEVDDEGQLLNLVNDMRRLLSGELGLPYLKFLLKWGFLAGDMADVLGTVDRKAFARYMAAISKGILVSLLEERSRAEAARSARKAGQIDRHN